jgi:hypothetical protein
MAGRAWSSLARLQPRATRFLISCLPATIRWSNNLLETGTLNQLSSSCPAACGGAQNVGIGT